ncbi:F0F1 ATP synthase subunit epsilon [Rhizobium sp. L1K21]|uniref:F0F1 ATP synthase subunit epsilon n=1 Tax=Rhizobium sp. L1K21 TaxID=2954933 RepID=UPI002091FD73|nr:F0F1 ATP synthase subunit epsilon [Rhizobium sp. L1K21]MCO6184909.1 F0F1 ATP synthase subunit epsilon [Rhizobium sp. L1K21]
MADSFNFELVSPERLLVSSEVVSVSIPATEGEMTVMAQHSPVMTTIKPGIVTVNGVDGKKDQYVVFGGFADILPAGCTLLAESAVHVDDISKDELDSRIEAARNELKDAQHHEHQSKLEEFIYHMTSLKDAVVE